MPTAWALRSTIVQLVIPIFKTKQNESSFIALEISAAFAHGWSGAAVTGRDTAAICHSCSGIFAARQ
jgi:hypothetical protein